MEFVLAILIWSILVSLYIIVCILHWLLKELFKKKKQVEADAIEILSCKECRTVNSCHGCDFLAKVNDGLVTIDNDGGTFHKEDGVGGL